MISFRSPLPALRLYRALLILLAAGLAAGAPAAEPGVPAPPGLASEEGGRVAEVIDGDTLALADGRQVRLVGIQAPKLPLGRPGFQTWPLAEEAKAALAELALGQEVRLAYAGRRGDRHGRVLAHVIGAEGTWVQGALLARGLARVYSFADNRAWVPEMLAHEAAARAAGRGIWGQPHYAVRTPAEVGEHVGGFELVEGRVLAVAVVRGRAYLNFGPDWRSDFTVVLHPEARRRFEAEGIDPRGYEGRTLRVRGWVKSYNGPQIEANHPEQIEVIAE